VINTYKRRTINQRAELHEHEFVTYDDCMEMLQKFLKAAQGAGADLNKMMSIIDDDDFYKATEK